MRNFASVDKLLEDERIKPLHLILSRPICADVIRTVLAALRTETDEDTSYNYDAIVAKCLTALQIKIKRPLQKIINASGTILHTNLGRSPLSKELWRQAEFLNTNHINLEYHINQQKRGGRAGFVNELLCKLTGAEAALVVNNNAAAIYLILKTLAGEGQVIISRGELVQIGGGFRIPDIMAEAGSRLVEVGTTNITTVDDYIHAITEHTKLLLKVHSSNFKIRGFTSSPSIKELRAALPSHIPLVYDEGAGVLEAGLSEDISIKQALKEGADLVCFSGDKFLGSVQAGIIVGKKAYIDRLAGHPLMRAFRCGKVILSLLEASLIDKLNNSERPIGYAAQLLAIKPTKVKAQAERLAKALPVGLAEVIEADVEVGGGSLPDEFYPSYAVAINCKVSLKVNQLVTALHNLPVPILGRVAEDRLLIYLLTIKEEDMDYAAEALVKILGKKDE